MIEVHTGLFVGSEADCRSADPNLQVVHACKSPCHQGAVGYRGSLSKTHPNYLSLQTGSDLYLNLIDPPVPLFQAESFRTFRAFAESALEEKQPLLIHCNQGQSRAPSLALLLLAKILEVVPNTSYEDAAQAFRNLYASYAPGRGIQIFLEKNWSAL